MWLRLAGVVAVVAMVLLTTLAGVPVSRDAIIAVVAIVLGLRDLKSLFHK